MSASASIKDVAPRLRVGVELGHAKPLGHWVQQLGGECAPDAESVAIRRVVEPGSGELAGDVSVVSEARWLSRALAGSETLIVAEKLAAALPRERCWRHTHPLWVMSRLLEVAPSNQSPTWFSEEAARRQFPAARLAPGCHIAAGARLGEGVELGPGVVIYAGVVLEAQVRVGAGSVLGRPGFGWTLAPGGNRIRIPQLGGVLVEEAAELGPLCSIDAGTLSATRIGPRSKLDAQVHIGHNARIGADCLIAAQCGLAGSVTLEDGVWLGGQVGVADHVTIGSGARVAAGSGVIGSVPSGSTFAGYPAVERQRWLRGMAQALPKRGTNSGEGRPR